jgi:hypothetical protein
MLNVRWGSWLCKNAETINRHRRNYSSRTALGAQLACELNLEVELKNFVLPAFRFFEFLHSQGQFQKSNRANATSAFPPLATRLRTSLEVRFVTKRRHSAKAISLNVYT